MTDEIMAPIFQLKKFQYSLPQASKYFDEHLSSRLLAMGLIRCIFDADVFILERVSEKVILSMHVDDYLLVGTRGTKLLYSVSSEHLKLSSLIIFIESTNFVGLVLYRDRAKKKYNYLIATLRKQNYRCIFCPYLYC